MNVRVLQLIICAVLVAMSTTVAQAQNRYALLIGNTGYQNITKLTNPIRDIELVAKTLRSAEFDVKVLKDASKAEMKREIDAFAAKLAANPGSVSLVYFAGHGLRSNMDPTAPDYKGETYNYVLGVNFNEADSLHAFENGAVRVDGPDSLTAALKAGRTAQNYLIIDACRNDFTPRASGLTRGFGVMKTPETGETFMVFATKPGEFAMDGPAGKGLPQNSPFAIAFTEAIQNRGHTLTALMPEITLHVRSLTGGAQTPWQQGAEAIRFNFFKPVSGMKENTRLKREKLDLAHWERVKNSRSVISISGYVDTFGPEARHYNDAKTLIERLNKGLDTDVETKQTTSLSATYGLVVGREFAGAPLKVMTVEKSSVFSGKLLENDQFYKLNGARVKDIADPEAMLADLLKSKRPVSLMVLRNNRPYTVNIR